MVLIVAATLFPIHVYAHSGGTDSKGGHYNRSTGEYHYHHGYSAHQHRDIDGDGKLDCPYEFNESSSKLFHASSAQNNPNDGTISFLLLTVSIETVVIIVFAFYCYDKKREINLLKKRHFEDIKNIEKDFKEKEASIIKGVKELSELESKIKTSHGNLADIIGQINSKKDALHFWETEEQKEKLKIDRIRESGIKEKEQAMLEASRIRKTPLNITLANDGYPIYWEPSTDKPYGDYTVFYNPKGQVYHLDRICSPYFSIEMHLFKAIPLGRPCKKCARKYQDFQIPEWFENPEK